MMSGLEQINALAKSMCLPFLFYFEFVMRKNVGVYSPILIISSTLFTGHQGSDMMRGMEQIGALAQSIVLPYLFCYEFLMY